MKGKKKLTQNSIILYFDTLSCNVWFFDGKFGQSYTVYTIKVWSKFLSQVTLRR
jgi:predicted transcriptional regulator